MPDLNSLEKLMEQGTYDLAVDYCQAALASGEDVRLWKTQLGYVCCGNDENIPRQYVQSSQIFMSLIIDYPNDPNAYFWFGYIELILYSRVAQAKDYFQKALALDPQHVFTNLVMASESSGTEKLRLLALVLDQQPNNYRALMESADVLIEVRQLADAGQFLRQILDSEPFWENGYGAMNQYINEIFNFAHWRDKKREEARYKLAELSGK